MRVGQDVLSDLEAALSVEWLQTNGLGGSASGTAAGAHTRGTHAHLSAAGLHGRLTTLLLRLEERLVDGEGPLELSTVVQSNGALRPAGCRLLEEFRLDPWPVWRFRARGVVLEKSLFMIAGHNAVAVGYRHLGGPPAHLTVSPLVVLRDPAELQSRMEVRGAAQGVPGRVRIETVDGGPTLTLWHNGAFLPARTWQRQHHAGPGGQHAISEDAFAAGYVESPLVPGASLHVIASAEDDLFRALAREDRLGSPPPRTLAGCVHELEQEARAQHDQWRTSAVAGAGHTARQARAARRGAESEDGAALELDDPWIQSLAESLRGGLTRRGHRLALVASLPKAEERPLDALRAATGLIALRGFDAAQAILRGAVEYLDDGLLPETFDLDDGRPRANASAAALWLVIVSELYVRRSRDVQLAKDLLYPALEGVMSFHRSGTRHGVRIAEDGLLAVGEGRTAERPASLNALWYHASVAMAHLARAIGRREPGAFYLAWAREHQRCFNQLMWDEARGRLHRALGARGPIPGVEPAQLWAVSLPPALLPPDRAKRLLLAIEHDLFTPYGLRPRAANDRVLPEWLGPFHSADVRANERDAAAQARVRDRLETLRRATARGVSGQVPEAFVIVPDADGATSPALAGDPVSVVAAGELLHLWVEELDHAAGREALVTAGAAGDETD